VFLKEEMSPAPNSWFNVLRMFNIRICPNIEYSVANPVYAEPKIFWVEGSARSGAFLFVKNTTIKTALLRGDHLKFLKIKIFSIQF
jgi:hypothetical protein